MLRHTAMLCYAMLCYVILYDTIRCDTILHYTTLYYTILYYTILFFTMRCYVMLCYALLCTSLHCIALDSTLLYYTILMHMHGRETWGDCPRILKQLSYNLHDKNYTAGSKITPRMLSENLKNPSKITSKSTKKMHPKSTLGPSLEPDLKKPP